MRKSNANVALGDSASDLSVSQAESRMTGNTTVKVTLDDAIAKIRAWLPIDGVRVAMDCQKELSEEGLLSGYYTRLRDGLPIDIQNLLEAVLVLNEISLIMRMFEQDFGWTKLIEYTND